MSAQALSCKKEHTPVAIGQGGEVWQYKWAVPVLHGLLDGRVCHWGRGRLFLLFLLPFLPDLGCVLSLELGCINTSLHTATKNVAQFVVGVS